MRLCFALAHRLGRPIDEILDMDYSMFVTWIAYLQEQDRKLRR